jgi:trigger factor
MKVNVKEEPAWRRVLDIEVDAEEVDRELDRVVDEYRKRLALPGFRKGHVPPEIARKHLGDDLEGEVLRRILPQAFEDAVRDAEIRPVGDPKLSNLQFNPGQPLTFTATVEVMPQVEIKGYEGLKLTRERVEIQEEELHRVLDKLRDQNADLEEVDRAAQGGDVVLIRYREIDEAGNSPGDDEPTEMSLTLGSETTPEAFDRELMGAVIGDMKKIPLAYPPDYPEENLAGTTRHFHVTVAKVQEKIWPPLDDAFARKVLDTEEATVNDLRSRVRLNLEVEARMRSARELENKLVARLLELNPFDVPQGLIDTTLDRILEDAKSDGKELPPDEASRLREHYRGEVERSYRTDILIETVGRKEQIEVTDEDLDKEIESFAEQEEKKPAQVKARLKKEGNLGRLQNDLFRRQVLDRLIEKADVTGNDAGQAEASQADEGQTEGEA